MKNLDQKKTTKKTLTVIAAALAAMLGLGLATDASAQQRAARPAPAQTEADTSPAANGVVNVNTATADELMRLPGIGPSKAAAILALRARMTGQRFARVEDLLRVRGIGRATLRKLRPIVSLSGATTYVEQSRTSSRRAAPAASAESAEESTEESGE
jgi:competence protein ComEA